MRTSHPRSASLGSSESRCASDPEMPATFWKCRIFAPFVLIAAPPRASLGPVLNRVTRRHPLAQNPADRGALRRGHHRQPLDASRQLRRGRRAANWSGTSRPSSSSSKTGFEAITGTQLAPAS